MNIEQFSIGNKVMYKNHIITLNVDNFRQLEHDLQNGFIKGIELNKDELIKLGCVESNGIIYKSIPIQKVELHFEVYRKEIVTTIKSDFCHLILDNIKYVHQLQNLIIVLET